MEFSEEHKMIRETVKAFTEKEIMPIADQVDREDKFPVEIFKKFAEVGLVGVIFPEKYGGIGSDIISQIIIMEEMSKGSAAITMSSEELVSTSIYHNGNEEQLKKFLPPFCSGDSIGAFCLTEPGAGSNALGITTSAVREGDYYRINGTKMFITNASIADIFLVMTKTDKTNPRHGITAFVLEKDKVEGLTVPRKLEKFGLRGSPTCEVVFEDVMVPTENILGEENEGVAVMMSTLNVDRLLVAAIAIGIAQAAFSASLKYSKEREQFGKPISSFQLTKAKLANMYTNIEAGRIMTYDIADRAVKNQNIRKEAAAAQLFTSEMATKICLDAIQIYGGYGYMLEFPVNRYLRDVKLIEIGAGTSEIRRLLIANEILRGQ